MDYHDEIMVDWRNDILGKAESFCHSNILNVTPPKFHYCTWYIVLGLGTIAALVV